MNRAMIFDVYPTKDERGNIVYRELSGLGGFGRLGVTSAQVVTTATNIQSVASAAAAAIPTQKVTIQSDFSKGANLVATGASTVAAALVAFAPAGTIVAVVAGVVAAAAALLGKIFANSKAKAYAAQRAEYDQVNAQLKFENQELDAQYTQTQDAINQLKTLVSSLSGVPAGLAQPTPVNGLGLCLWNCKDEKNALAAAQAENELLVKQQESKGELLASLLNEYNKLLKAAFELKASKSTKDWILYVLIAGAVLGGGYAIMKSKK